MWNKHKEVVSKPEDLRSGPAAKHDEDLASRIQPAAYRVQAETTRGSATIGRSIVVKGEIRSGEDLFLDGQMEGKLDLGQHRLTVGPNGQVRATIRAREVEIMGAVNGNVEAMERIIIRKNAKLTGDLKMAGVVIEDGAYFKGSIDITQPNGEKASGALAARKPVSQAASG
jgi:cytoskeletal protein CcmA (bactofilin family)